MGGVLTLDAAFLGSVPADLGKALLERARADCGPVLHRAIESMREPLATMAGYHLGWWNADRSTAAGSSGKYFRAALVYAAAAACGGDVGDATPVSAAVELVHNFTLLHDDVMDGDATRRGRPTVWSVWGVGGAILLGDALHATAVRILTGLTDECVAVRAIRRLQMSCLDLCIGQFEDCLLEGQPEPPRHVRRLQFLERMGSCQVVHRGGTRRSCVSGRCGWSQRSAVSTIRSGQRSVRSPVYLVLAARRRCVSGCARRRSMPAHGPGPRPKNPLS